ncbi:MAG: hypothetical protein K2Q24_03735 [Chitinophagaceae bacterium]|nr:hypothetical protein [Chitinophagaceae bacterium]
MQKFTNYIILFVILSAGLLSLYRVFLSSNNLTKIDAKVLAKKIEIISTHNQSNRYGLIFEVDNYKDKLGIYLGTKDQSSGNQISNIFETNKVYSFLVDPTVLSDNGINLGVREIKLNGTNIYKESQKFNLFLGIFFTVLGTGGLFVINKFKRIKKAS